MLNFLLLFGLSRGRTATRLLLRLVTRLPLSLVIAGAGLRLTRKE